MDSLVPNFQRGLYQDGMARPREFDTDVTLSKAMDVFWETGYAEAKLPDLLAGMNLSRGSLYKAFKDKKSLFLLVLNHYDDQAVSDAVSVLRDSEKDGWARIFATFDTIAETVDAGDRRGCLLCSAVAGPASYDTEIAAFANKSLDRMRIAFRQAILESGDPRDAENMAHLLVAQYLGLRIMSRTSVSPTIIKKNINALKNLVKASRV